MNLKFFGGVNTIGGNKILLEDSDTKLFLDFGMNFSENALYFEEYMKPRVGNGLGDWAELGLIPHPKKLKGFYRNDLLKMGDYLIEKQALFDGVLLSHCHFDHAAHLCFMDERIPIYSSEITNAMIKAIQEIGTGTIDTEICSYKPRPAERGAELIERQFNPVESEKTFKVGNLEIKPFAVDHSVPGAMSYLIYTSEGTVFYSGDLRMHGTYGSLTEMMLEEVQKEKIDLMLCEGTRIMDTEKQSEKLVKEDSHNLISKAENLAIADYAFKDLTRFKTFYEIAKENNRKLVVQMKDAYLVRELGHLVELPKINDENILIYLGKRGTGTYSEKDFPRKWMKEMYGLSNTITAEGVCQSQKDYLVRLGFYDFNNLVDLKPKKNSVYIHSMCEAFNEEMAISHDRQKNWLEKFGLEYNYAHCSGHAGREELKEIINTIRPKTLIPIHTEHANQFRKIAEKKIRIRKAKAE